MRLHTLFDAIDGHLRRHHGTGAGWHNWPEEYRAPGERGGAALRAGTRRRGGFPRLPAVARRRAVRRRAPAGARAGLERRHLRRLRRGRERVGLGDLVRSVAVLHGRRHRRAARSASASAGRSGAFRRRIRAQLRRTAYAPFVALVRASMRNCGALRLDHVMALFRQWWVPRGFKSADGGYVHYPLEDLLGVVALESHRNAMPGGGRRPGRGARRDPPRAAAVRRVSLQGGDVRAEERRVRRARRLHRVMRWPPSPRTICRRCTAGGAVMTSTCGKSSAFYADASVGERARAERQRGTRTAAARAAPRETVAREAGPRCRNIRPSSARAVHAYLGKSPTALVTVQTRGHDRHARARERSRHQQRILQLDAAHDGERARNLRARRRARVVRRHGARSRKIASTMSALLQSLIYTAQRAGRRHHGGVRHGFLRARQGGCVAGHRGRRSRRENHPRGSRGHRAGRAGHRRRSRGRRQGAGRSPSASSSSIRSMARASS